MAVKVKLTDAVLGLVGATVIVVSGGELSTTTVCLAELRMFPAASVARASTW